MVCGEVMTTYFDFWTACLSLNYYGLARCVHAADNLISAVAVGTLQIYQIKKDSEWTGRSIMRPLIMRRNAQATDPRNKVFAYCGIARERNLEGLQPDYRKSAEEVYRDAAAALLTQGSPDVTKDVDKGDNHDSRQESPRRNKQISTPNIQNTETLRKKDIHRRKVEMTLGSDSNTPSSLMIQWTKRHQTPIYSGILIWIY
jgi:hypothetical protein